MPIVTVDRFDRANLRASPDRLFVFGDNDARAGLGGQAAECRGEPNAIGIPTKRAPSMAPGSFYTDADLERVRPVMQEAFRRLADHLRAGGTVVLPADGLGTGRAELAERAPALRAFLDRCLAHLEKVADECEPTAVPPAEPVVIRSSSPHCRRGLCPARRRSAARVGQPVPPLAHRHAVDHRPDVLPGD